MKERAWMSLKKKKVKGKKQAKGKVEKSEIQWRKRGK
jgi:hypothetical protein